MIGDGSGTGTGEDGFGLGTNDLAGDLINRLLMEVTRLSTMISSSSSVLESLPDAQNLPPILLSMP
jgi:hypothetical protein